MPEGLLDFIKTPEGQGLLATVFGGLAGARTGQPINSLGRAGLAGIAGYGNAIERNSQTGRDELAKRMQEQGMQLQTMQMDRMKRQYGKEDRVDALGPQFFTPGTPEQAGIPSDVGPMPPTPAKPPSFDMQGYGTALMGVDPTKGAAFMQGMLKDKPQLVTVQTPSGPMQRWLRPGESTGSDVGAPADKESTLPWYVQKGANGMSIDPAYAELEKTKAAFGRPPSQPMAPVAYMNDQGQTVWGTITDARGKQAANYSPTLQGQIAGAKAEASQIGTGKGESAVRLQGAESALPGLENVVKDLSELGKKATYTMTGQAADTLRRQLGMDVGPGAVARKEYTSKVDNEVLPLLRTTFGAAFTQKEGESLKATLGDVNASPEEKDAVLRSFIQTKRAQIEGMKGTTPQIATMRWNPQTRKLEQVK